MIHDLTFLQQKAEEVAPGILGWELFHLTKQGRVGGIIIETEAYNQRDPASHSFRGLTPRTAPMFAQAGTIYVYLSYGMHYCMNIVCGKEGEGEAVLIRSLLPTEGIPLMQDKRGIENISNLCNGPGKLTQALGISATHNFTHLSSGPLQLHPCHSLPFSAGPRIGISKAKELPWRFVAHTPV